MRVEEVIAAFVQGDVGRSQNLRAYHRTHQGVRFGILSTYDEPIAVRDEAGTIWIDKDSKYTVTSTKHRNTTIAMTKASGVEPRWITRAEVRETAGLDPNEQFTPAKKLPYRAGGSAGIVAPATVPHEPVASTPKPQEVKVFEIPALIGSRTAITDPDPFELLRQIVEVGDDALNGADVCVVNTRPKDGFVAFLDDDGNQLVVEDGLHDVRVEAVKANLQRALQHLGFTAETMEPFEKVSTLTGKPIAVILANGELTLYEDVEWQSAAEEHEHQLEEANEKEVVAVASDEEDPF
jgi:hypothetical protein